MTPVGGTLSLTVGLTGPGYFDGNAILKNNGAGNIALDVYNYGNGSFSSSGSNASGATVTSIYGNGTENVNDMHIDGGFSGSHANGNWNMTVGGNSDRSEEHTSELQSLMRISYAVFCLKTTIKKQHKQAY